MYQNTNSVISIGTDNAASNTTRNEQHFCKCLSFTIYLFYFIVRVVALTHFVYVVVIAVVINVALLSVAVLQFRLNYPHISSQHKLRKQMGQRQVTLIT